MAQNLTELISDIMDYFFAHPDEVPEFLSAIEQLKEIPPFLQEQRGEITAEDSAAAMRKFRQGERLTQEEGAATIKDDIEGEQNV